MTVLTDTQIVTASGGLVELGYIASSATSTTITAGSNAVLLGPVTVVCDGSPIFVEVAFPRLDVNAGGEARATVEIDGGANSTYVIDSYNPGTQYSAATAQGRIRLTPSPGSHTIQVRGYSVSQSSTWFGTSVGTAFLRVSKIVQASQWPAVTTGTIICTSSTRPASPFVGQQIYETDTKKKWTYDGAAWYTEGLQYEANVAVQQSITTNADVTGMTTGSSFSAVSGRKYRATFYCPQASGTSGERMRVTILTGASVIQTAYTNLTSYGVPIYMVATFTGSGATTVKVQAFRDQGTNTALLYADSTSLMKLLVEDIGPA